MPSAYSPRPDRNTLADFNSWMGVWLQDYEVRRLDLVGLGSMATVAIPEFVGPQLTAVSPHQRAVLTFYIQTKRCSYNPPLRATVGSPARAPPSISSSGATRSPRPPHSLNIIFLSILPPLSQTAALPRNPVSPPNQSTTPTLMTNPTTLARSTPPGAAGPRVYTGNHVPRQPLPPVGTGSLPVPSAPTPSLGQNPAAPSLCAARAGASTAITPPSPASTTKAGATVNLSKPHTTQALTVASCNSIVIVLVSLVPFRGTCWRLHSDQPSITGIH